jgi:hypothetical protein
MSCVLFQDPIHPYAVHLMQHVHRRYGHRAVCFYTQRRRRLLYERSYPALRSPIVEASYDVALHDLARFAERVRKRHDIVGVLPFNEETLLPSSQLAEWLALGWNQLDSIRRFRDKHALKEFLRVRCPGIRMNRSRLVETVDDVFPGGAAPFEDYVLKPNDGWGNRDIARFGAATPGARDAVAAYLRRVHRRPLVMEEYIDGNEYFVNGQVGASGEIDVVAVFRYGRVPANGRSDIDCDTWSVGRSDPAFAKLTAYVREVIAASGLVRSPFHVEVKIDDQGPCLIEAAARLAGNGNVFVCNALHGGALDLFDAAVHGYLSSKPYGPLATDWERYDATRAVYVHGIGTRRERIHTLQGLSEVERLPAFAGWVHKPAIGDRVVPTVSSLSAPWAVLLTGPSEDEATLRKTVDAVRSLVVINGPSRGAAVKKTLMALRAMGRRARDEVRWALVSTTPPDCGRGPSARPGWAERLVNARSVLLGRLQRAGLRPSAEAIPAPLSPRQIDVANQVMRWAEEFIASPHPELGRKGPICPFVQKTIDVDQLLIGVYDKIDGTSPVPIRDVVLAQADHLKARVPIGAPNGGFSGVVMAFPDIPPEHGDVLDLVHTELKTHLMERDVMAGAFHPGSTKPAMQNPKFFPFRAPIPSFVVRHVDVRDIVFLGHNRNAFERFRARFHDQFARGLVSNEFGYVDMYQQALARFPGANRSGKL